MTRPLFSRAWAASARIYDPVDPSAKVAQVIGGKVALNIAPQGKWENTCAVRISYILNQCGMHIPYITNQTVSGADGRWHFYYVRDIIKFVTQKWGQPDLIIRYPVLAAEDLEDKKGLILFEVSGWQDAAGHATLWNGYRCYDSCYFDGPNVNYRTEKASFWELP